EIRRMYSCKKKEANSQKCINIVGTRHLQRRGIFIHCFMNVDGNYSRTKELYVISHQINGCGQVMARALVSFLLKIPIQFCWLILQVKRFLNLTQWIPIFYCL